MIKLKTMQSENDFQRELRLWDQMSSEGKFTRITFFFCK